MSFEINDYKFITYGLVAINVGIVYIGKMFQVCNFQAGDIYVTFISRFWIVTTHFSVFGHAAFIRQNQAAAACQPCVNVTTLPQYEMPG